MEGINRQKILTKTIFTADSAEQNTTGTIFSQRVVKESLFKWNHLLTCVPPASSANLPSSAVRPGRQRGSRKCGNFFLPHAD